MPEHNPIASMRVRAAVLLLASQMGCGGEGAPQAMPPESAPPLVRPVTPAASEIPEAGATAPAASPRPMAPGRIWAPMTGEIACPSQEFEPFLHAFLNSGDLQVRFTARPMTHKLPYYDHHNTEAGDPTNPQWETYEGDRPMHDLDRYDPHMQGYVVDSDRLYPGEVWTGIDADGKHVSNPISELRTRQVSETEAEVLTRGRITTFSHRQDCWYLTQDWSLDPLEGCRWPDECRSLREYEAPYYDDEDD